MHLFKVSFKGKGIRNAEESTREREIKVISETNKSEGNSKILKI